MKVERNFDFWQDHSETYLTNAYLWDRRKVIDTPDGFGKKTGDCGDTITIFLTIDNGRIKQVNFKLDGCINTNACCNGLAILVEGKRIDQSWNISSDDIIKHLKTLPVDHYHCAELTVGTFYLALADYNERRKVE